VICDDDDDDDDDDEQVVGLGLLLGRQRDAEQINEVEQHIACSMTRDTSQV
jgi:hypothetical protein